MQFHLHASSSNSHDIFFVDSENASRSLVCFFSCACLNASLTHSLARSCDKILTYSRLQFQCVKPQNKINKWKVFFCNQQFLMDEIFVNFRPSGNHSKWHFSKHIVDSSTAVTLLLTQYLSTKSFTYTETIVTKHITKRTISLCQIIH